MYLHSPSPRASSALWTPDSIISPSACFYFCVLTKLDPCVLGGWGKGLQELVNVNTLSAIKICNLTSLKRYEEYPRLFLMYLVPLPSPPLGAEGRWVPIMSTIPR